jgi:hypothetical protein
MSKPTDSTLKEFLPSMMAAASTAAARKSSSSSSRTSSSSFGGSDTVTQTDVDGVLRGIENRGSQTTAQLAGAVRNKLRVDPKNTKVIASITDMIEKTMKRGKYGTYGESLRSLYKEEMAEDDYRDTMASAEMAHYGQKRRSGEDYITHPKEVSAIVDKLYAGDELAKLVALLHDTLEDAPSLGTVRDVEEMKSFIRGSIGGDISVAEDVIDAVESLTHESGGDYSTYVQGLLNNKLALRVKLADMLHNLSSSPSPKQKQKYRDALEALKLAAGGGKPPGISPLHWKLLEKAAGGFTTTSESNHMTKNDLKRLIQESVKKALKEQSMDERNPQGQELKDLEAMALAAYKRWRRTELRHALSEYIFDRSDDVYQPNLRKEMENLHRHLTGDLRSGTMDIQAWDLLETPDAKAFIQSNVQDPLAAEMFYEMTFSPEFYNELEKRLAWDIDQVFDDVAQRYM